MRIICFTSYLAVGHRIECKDHIGVYSVQPWQELSKFRSRTNDMVSLQWTPRGTHLVAQDSQLQYRVMVYTPAGEVSVLCIGCFFIIELKAACGKLRKVSFLFGCSLSFICLFFLHFYVHFNCAMLYLLNGTLKITSPDYSMFVHF